MTNKRRFFAMLLALVMSISCLTVTASAEANPPSDDVIIWTSEPTEPQETRPAETQPPATEPAPTEPAPTEPEPETNAIVRDLLYHEETNKQFITVETRSGEVFYIIIDYDAPTDEKNEQFHTYFLNKVDDADLQALLEDGTVVTCSCVNRCEAGAVNTSCEICAKNMTECAGTRVEPQTEPTTPPTEPTEEPQEGVNPAAVIAVVLLLILFGAMGYFFLKERFPAKKEKGSTDLDDYDYGMDDEEDEYAEFESYDEDKETEDA